MSRIPTRKNNVLTDHNECGPAPTSRGSPAKDLVPTSRRDGGALANMPPFGHNR